MMMFIDYICKLEGNFFSSEFKIFSKGKNVNEPIRTKYALSRKRKDLLPNMLKVVKHHETLRCYDTRIEAYVVIVGIAMVTQGQS